VQVPTAGVDVTGEDELVHRGRVNQDQRGQDDQHDRGAACHRPSACPMDAILDEVPRVEGLPSSVVTARLRVPSMSPRSHNQPTADRTSPVLAQAEQGPAMISHHQPAPPALSRNA
jgi:hypothetical protein